MEDRHRSFHTGPPPDSVISFDIDGERFVCRPDLPGIRFIHYSRKFDRAAANARAIRDGKQVADPDRLYTNIDVIMNFYSEAMESAEHERFIKFIEDPDRIVSTQLLGDVFMYLWEEYANRPISPSGQSEPGRSKAKRTSSARSSSKASPSKSSDGGKP